MRRRMTGRKSSRTGQLTGMGQRNRHRTSRSINAKLVRGRDGDFDALQGRSAWPTANDTAVRRILVGPRQGDSHREGFSVIWWLIKGAILALMWLKGLSFGIAKVLGLGPGCGGAHAPMDKLGVL